VALEVLREALSPSKATLDEIMRFAHVCRVASVISPYLEANT
jgi:hypothetical protein